MLVFPCFQCFFNPNSLRFDVPLFLYPSPGIDLFRRKHARNLLFFFWLSEKNTFRRRWNLGVGIFEIELPDSWGGCWELFFFLRNDLFFNLFRRAKIRPNIWTKMSQIIFNFKYFPDQNCFGRFHTVICFQKPPFFCHSMVTMIQFIFRYFFLVP